MCVSVISSHLPFIRLCHRHADSATKVFQPTEKAARSVECGACSRTNFAPGLSAAGGMSALMSVARGTLNRGLHAELRLHSIPALPSDGHIPTSPLTFFLALRAASSHTYKLSLSRIQMFGISGAASAPSGVTQLTFGAEKFLFCASEGRVIYLLMTYSGLWWVDTVSTSGEVTAMLS